MVALTYGLAGPQRADLSAIADHASSAATDQESIITRFRRWLKHDARTVDRWFLPVTQAVLRNLAHQLLVLVKDGSVVGRGGVVLMLSAVYHGRAVPLVWLVVAGTKGNFPAAVHCAPPTTRAAISTCGTPRMMRRSIS